MNCSSCGKEISIVLYTFTVARYGTPYCYGCMKDSNAERRVWKEDLKQQEKSKGDKK